MTVSVINNPAKDKVSIVLHRSTRDWLFSEKLTIEEFEGKLRIREAKLSDNKILTYKKSNPIVSYMSKTAKDYVGKWELKIEGEWLVLNNKIEK